ncbi:tryptophan halogenase family protein [Sphingomonas nostoxanthinifaciens]|uniref:tryptophan halogenase family protein n=1 Tax=Sphingomonas nostoxanthinifaciens TaxID=2872652 RepID=UPI001CC1CBF3|nr:tryptophan halogenase family protein [Sphingomonas nostoxanthinifaciens]UAK25912.1 tryptophan 7-halogenase [Sphingomonas nostoxanthinifaciens]
MTNEPVRRVVILGGGTAGWMTAAALSRALAKTGIGITLVESEEIGTVGVGESTIPTIHWFNNLVGLDEARFMAETRATVKLGIEFRGWQGSDSAYFHPFGTYGGPGDATMFPHRLIRAWLDGAAAEIEDYSLNTCIARARRFTRPVGDPRSLLSTLGYAFHFDAGLYARFLRTIAEANGMVRVEGKVGHVEQDAESGFVRALTLECGASLAGDLFIDCSGLRGLLIEQTLGAGFEDWSDWLPCDGAWAAPSAPEPSITPYTQAIAHAAGWRWRIPLQHRVGNGHVFSSRFQSAEDARQALIDAMDGPPTAEPRLIRFTPGRRRRAWIGNVVAIGLSSGFLEPLESTSIHLIQTGIGKLLSLFPRANCDPLLAEQYNRVTQREIEDVRDFLILHYRMTQGRDEPMWRHCQSTPLPEALAQKIEQYRASGRLMLQPDELFRDASWFAVLTGQGVAARDYNPLLDAGSADENLQHLASIRAAIHASCDRIPPIQPAPARRSA